MYSITILLVLLAIQPLPFFWLIATSPFLILVPLGMGLVGGLLDTGRVKKPLWFVRLYLGSIPALTLGLILGLYSGMVLGGGINPPVSTTATNTIYAYTTKIFVTIFTIIFGYLLGLVLLPSKESIESDEAFRKANGRAIILGVVIAALYLLLPFAKPELLGF